MTIFDQFCGGTTLEKCKPTIQQLKKYKVQTILDYGAEAKTTEEEFNKSMEELLNAIQFATKNESVSVISMKMTGLVNFDILQSLQAKKQLSQKDEQYYNNFIERLAKIATAAEHASVGVFVDAEESWIQDIIDKHVNLLMAKHNKTKPIIFNTFQMYRHDRFNYLQESLKKATEENYILGAKIVRGAYMEKERSRALTLNYPSPIQKDKDATDLDYNKAITFCVKNHSKIASYNATHNNMSNLLQAQLIIDNNIDKNHPHLNFCQLYGMSDQITFNLGAADFNSMKYVPYGKVKEVIPYLIRRAQENTSISGEMGREYKMITQERKRRNV